ncbi:hypothetical protein BIV57_15165 [Mangrovactinospora gilvigrisea]|uniref:QacE family quaternary ammonium compound efflux SMR transporter n=1 Tax=Mangrovactinospora gilvigrisea TaxID=1428644 RepID=A0A1J7C508_9ACTN|nr:multidrug efflux SMR transporter [Mangrovactinospora gilvigrisea]OIV36640.1 hypothetical protein BIV57_15165 [Mangrovactinospora gilvigrisea]
MAWIMLIVAGLFEVAWSTLMKYSHGFTRLWPSIGFVVTLVLSMGLLTAATKHLPLGTAYGVWVGVGAVGAAVLGIVLFKEPVTAARIFFICLLIASIIGLKATSH